MEAFGLEIIFFIFSLCFGIVVYIINFRLSRTILLLYFLAFEYFHRVLSVDGDIVEYFRYMTYDFVSSGFFFWREPLSFGLMSYLYRLLEDQYLVFFCLDFICFYFVYRFFLVKGINFGLLIFFSTTFPFVLGFQNVYRQFMSVCFLLFCFSCRFSFFIRLFAGFFHNAFFLLSFSHIGRRYFMISMTFSFLMIIVASNLSIGKSDFQIGFNVAPLYLIFIFYIFLLSSLRFDLSCVVLSENSWLILCLFVTSCFSFLIFSEAQSERLLLGVLFICLPAGFAARITSNFSSRVFLLVTYLPFSLLIFFSEARSFLFLG